jgi:glycosyltransferase involved in cell wall biosynthesis
MTSTDAELKKPKVSVILTTYNRGEILGPTIESILAQTLGEFELVISDDCSKDDTERVCREYERRDARVHYRRGSKNIGMPGNLNAGIEASSGDYIANLHDGDLYEPMLLEKWSAALDKYPQAAFVFNAYRKIDSRGRTVRIYREPLGPCVHGVVLLERTFFRRWRFSSPVWGTVMGRRSAYLKVGLFDPRFGFLSDVDMWMRLAEEFDVAYLREPLITLACRETVPRLWGDAEKLSQTQLEGMFREARLRRYHDRPASLAGEMMRHFSFVAASRVFNPAFSFMRSITSTLRLRPE